VGLSVLDAGVVIAVLDPADAHHDAATAVLEQAELAGDRFTLPASAYAECLVSPSRHGRAAIRAVDRYIEDLAAYIEPVTREVAKQAAVLRARHGRRLPLSDALVVATALVLRADRVLTTDAGWPRLTMPVTIVRP
jgi:predicted nucleic acid-binding protein